MVEALSQAVILCGGRGTRLGGLTDFAPKPMMDVNGEPFLARLIEMLRGSGLEKVLLLTGYRGEQIREYFRDGSKFGVAVEYSHGPGEWSTGRRLLEARDYLDEHFVLCYGDNFAPLPLDYAGRGLEDLVSTSGQELAVRLVTSAKTPGNVVTDSDSDSVRYLVNRSPQAHLVEIGFMVAARVRLLRAISDCKVSLPEGLHALSTEGAVGHWEMGFPYLSISDVKRLEYTRQVLRRKKILLLDRDGVINHKPETGRYVTNVEEFRTKADSMAAIAWLALQGFKFIVISNQAGLARGMVSEEDLSVIHDRMRQIFRSNDADLLDILVCPHHWDERCICRKPLPGMIYDAAARHRFSPSDVCFVGDDIRDAQAAVAAGSTPVLIGQHEPSLNNVPTFMSFLDSLSFLNEFYRGV